MHWNSVDPDQMTSNKASWSGSTLLLYLHNVAMVLMKLHNLIDLKSCPTPPPPPHKKTKTKRVCNWKLFFIFLNQNICYGYSKEPSQWDGSFEHPKHMFKLMDKKIITILRRTFLLNWPYGSNLKMINSFIASGNFYYLPITFANSLNQIRTDRII